MQHSRIEQAVDVLLQAIGEDPNREGLRDTPHRVSQMYQELFAGVGVNPADAIDAIFNEDQHDPVVMRDVSFYSICEHHLLPFFGHAHMAYVPNGRIAGLSKLARALEIAARRPQVQERLTGQIADAIYASLDAKSVAVEVEAEHLCMSMRGVRKPGSRVITTAIRGSFESTGIDRQELLALLRGK